jgi:hypothetical protein
MLLNALLLSEGGAILFTLLREIYSYQDLKSLALHAGMLTIATVVMVVQT